MNTNTLLPMSIPIPMTINTSQPPLPLSMNDIVIIFRSVYNRLQEILKVFMAHKNEVVASFAKTMSITAEKMYQSKNVINEINENKLKTIMPMRSGSGGRSKRSKRRKRSNKSNKSKKRKKSTGGSLTSFDLPFIAFYVFQCALICYLMEAPISATMPPAILGFVTLWYWMTGTYRYGRRY